MPGCTRAGGDQGSDSGSDQGNRRKWGADG